MLIKKKGVKLINQGMDQFKKIQATIEEGRRQVKEEKKANSKRITQIEKDAQAAAGKLTDANTALDKALSETDVVVHNLSTLQKKKL